MSIESPSGRDFKQLGEILFYALILPALFYYSWQALKALFGLIVGAFESSEERKPLINASNVVEDNPMLLRVEVAKVTSSRRNLETTEYNVRDTFGDDALAAKNVPEMKKIISEKIHVDSNTIKGLEFFRKKIIPPTKFNAGDPEPTDLNTACYLQINAEKVTKAGVSLSEETYYFKYIQGCSEPGDQKQIGTADTFKEVREKISLRVRGKSDPKIRLALWGRDMSCCLEDKDQLRGMCELMPHTIHKVTMKNEWRTGYVKEEREDCVMRITF